MHKTSTMFNHHETKNNMVDTVIQARIAYSFYAVPYFMPSLKNLNKKIIAPLKNIWITKLYPKCHHTTPNELFGLQAFSLKNANLQ